MQESYLLCWVDEKKPALETHKDHNLFPGKEIETVGQDCHFGIREMK